MLLYRPTACFYPAIGCNTNKIRMNGHQGHIDITLATDPLAAVTLSYLFTYLTYTVRPTIVT